MTKTEDRELIDWIKGDLITYLQNGIINTEEWSGSIDFGGLNIGSFDRLKEIHLALDQSLVKKGFIDDFIKQESIYRDDYNIGADIQKHRKEQIKNEKSRKNIEKQE